MNTSKKQVQTMCITAMLIALGVLVPMISPIKLILEPMSFTLGSHIAIMAAMFVSPFSAVSVALGTAAGFYLAGFTLPVVLRSLSHVVCACYLQKHPSLFSSLPQTAVFTLAIALLHALCEVLVVLPLYTGYGVSELVYLLFGLVGIGTIAHSVVDFVLSLLVWKVLCHSSSVQQLAVIKTVSLKS